MKRATRAWDSEIRQRWLRSWTDRHGPVEEAGPAPVAARRRIGNRFPPPPLFLHEPGRFEGTQVDSSRLGGCRQTLDVERVRPQTARRQSVTETRSNGFDSLPPGCSSFLGCRRRAVRPLHIRKNDKRGGRQDVHLPEYQGFGPLQQRYWGTPAT